MRAYFHSVWHVVLMVALMLVSAVFGFEVPVYYAYLVFALFICLFGDDMLGVLPIVLCLPMTFSIPNNPERFPETNILTQPASVLQIGYMVAIFLVLLLARLVSLLIQNHKRGVPRFTASLLLLSLVYMLGGVGSEYYGQNTILFGLAQGAAICLFYFYFYFTVDWNKVKKGYIAMVFAVIGFALVLQILNMYFREGVVVDGVINRGQLFTGWGHYNYVGAVTAMCIPAIFYFALTCKHSWIFTTFATVVMLGVVLSQSRGAMLFGGFIYVVCAILTLIKTPKKEKIFNIIVLGVVLAAGIALSIIYIEPLKKIFADIFDMGFNNNGRFSIFIAAWNYFLSNPAFGVGWMGDPTVYGYFSPGFFMAHNTVMQFLGSMGAVGMAVYLFHRVQTCIVLFRRLTWEKACIFFSVVVLLLICMVDVHLFSIGPAMLYSVLILFMEGADKRDGVDTRIRLRRRKKQQYQIV